MDIEEDKQYNELLNTDEIRLHIQNRKYDIIFAKVNKKLWNKLNFKTKINLIKEFNYLNKAKKIEIQIQRTISNI